MSLSPPRRRLAAGVVSAIAAAAALSATATPADADPAPAKSAVAKSTAATSAANGKAVANSRATRRAATRPVDVQLLALNDFHGNLEPPTGGGGVIDGQPAGGSEFLATQLALLESQANKKNTITVAAGDLIGASPLLSAAFRDEPAIESLSLAGLDYASVGNHEFDEGADELLRIQDGGCHPVDGCFDPANPYGGAGFQYLSANAFVKKTGEPLLPPYAIHQVQGVKVGFIGMTLEGTPNIVAQEGIRDLTFTDEVETANLYAGELQARGVEAIVVLLHEGGQQTGAGGGGINQCQGLTGPIVDIAAGMSPAIDVVVSGHTHQAYNCQLSGKLVTSASAFGRLVTDIDLKIDPRSGDVISAAALNTVVKREVRDPQQTTLIERYRRLLGPIAARQVGLTTTAITRNQRTLFGTFRGESALGNLIADAQLAATDNEQGAIAAFMNPGGVRADLDAGPVTYEEAFTVQPFNNNLTTLTLTGAQLQALLEEQFVTARTLYPAGITYSVSAGGTTGTVANPGSGTRVPDDSVRIAGAPVTPTGSYRITVNSFLADGGDGFTTLRLGTNRVVGGLDIDALADYLPDTTAIATPLTDRITVLS